LIGGCPRTYGLDKPVPTSENKHWRVQMGDCTRSVIGISRKWEVLAGPYEPDDERPVSPSQSHYATVKVRPFLPKSERVRQILVNSKKWDGILDRKVQFAFIDADHSYEGIRNDTEKTLPNLDTSACICWHDSLESDFGFGTMQYLLELAEKGWKIFRIRGMHEISSLTIFMTDELREKLKIPEPQTGDYLFRDYVGR
jgi:hypothetical protein